MSEINHAILEALPDLTLVVRSDGVIVGNVGGRHLGIADEPGELIGTSLRQVWTGDIASHLNLLVRRTLRTRTPVDRRYSYRDRTYEVRVQPQGVDRVLMVLRDVSKDTARTGSQPMLEEVESKVLEHRAAFDNRLETAVTNCRLREMPLALAAIHLGGLRDARNVLGPAACSRLLGNVLKGLQSPTPLPGETPPHLSPFGRIRSDLLVVLFFGMPDRRSVTHAADRIRRALLEPLVDGEKTAHLRPTLGIAQYPNDGATPHLLLESARAALAAARQSDHDSTVVFSTRTMQIPVMDLPDFEQELRWALEHDQLALHYQPVLELKSRKTLSYEALIRWLHPVCGEMLPEQFLHVAEHCPLGTDIDEWALRRACADLAALSVDADGPARVAVNFGRRMLEVQDLAPRLLACAQSSGVSPKQIDVNISERIMATAGSRLDRLRELRECGVKVFVDGFGTGRIALDRLSSLPIDGIGIDRAFISRIEHDSGARAMCKSVVSIAHAFGLRSVAVGVEKQSQLDFISTIGCDAVQGRFLCEPLSVDRFEPTTDAPRARKVAGGRR
jgi:predicted signal transduction protein with EAL and GGDEF domain